MRRFTAVAVLATAALGVGTGPAAAATRTVDDDRAQCPTAPFTTIQSAVDAARPGDRVLVCNGTYREQVVIGGPGKNHLDLVAKSIRGATIALPATLAAPAAAVFVDGAGGVKVRRFRIVGPGPDGTEPVGVLVENNATLAAASVTDNLIADIRSIVDHTPHELLGDGVRVGQFFGSAGRAAVIGNEIVRFGFRGVTVTQDGSWAQVDANTIRGLAGDALGRQDGVFVFNGAAASVTGNSISDNSLGFCDDEDCTTVTFSAGVSIWETTASKDPQGTRRTQIKGNNLFDNADAIALTIVRNQNVETNRAHANWRGIVVDEFRAGSQRNRFYNNDVRNNSEQDCFDATSGSGTAGTANTWIGNQGLTDFPEGICTP